MSYAMASQITGISLFAQLLVQEIKENIIAPHHWHLCRKVIGDFPAQKASNMESASILWRHHV